MTDSKTALDAIVADYWDALLAREPYYAIPAGRTVTRLSRGDLAEVEADAAAAAKRRDALDTIDLAGLGRDDRLTAAYLRHVLDLEIEAPARWWTSFGIAPYSASGLSMVARMVFAPIDLTDDAEAARYLQLAEDQAGIVEAMRERILMQAARGWRIPKPALANVRRSLQGIGSMVAAAVEPAAERPASDATRAAIAAIVEDRLKPAFARLIDAIGPEYEAAAPEAAGMLHQPGGAEAYRLWLRYHLDEDLDPVELHRLGLAEVARLTAAMEKVRVERFGHNGDEASFHARLAEDPKAKAATPEALEATYHRHLDRMKPVFARMFRKGPQAKPRVERLARELEAGMTFGYYDAPKTPGADGTYHYSGNGIPDRMQVNAAVLIFHELVPGHHVHISRQQENAALPELRRTLFPFSAFNEGWAEYASALGAEADLFDDPYDHYGLLSHQRFTASRLVLDTGLNALGWTLDEARAFMTANTLEKPEQIASELLRYATDLPGQALCYRWGPIRFGELRARAEATLGDKFDLAYFHEAILEQGSLPMPVLERSLAEWAAERAAA